MEPTTLLRLGPGDQGRLVTDEEFAEAVYDEPWTYERERGRLIVLAPEGTGHVLASNRWRDRLIAYTFCHPERVEEVVGHAWVRIPDGGDRIGDLGVYLVQPSQTIEIRIQPPELMFEIVSGSKADNRRDYVAKRADYHAIGIREYVIVDRFARRVTVLRWEPGDYRETVLLVGETYSTPLLPGLEILLSESFAA